MNNISQGTAGYQRIGNKILGTGIKFTGTYVNVTAVALHIRVMLVALKGNMNLVTDEIFYDPVTADNVTWSAIDATPNSVKLGLTKEAGVILRQKSFILAPNTQAGHTKLIKWRKRLKHKCFYDGNTTGLNQTWQFYWMVTGWAPTIAYASQSSHSIRHTEQFDFFFKDL